MYEKQTAECVEVDPKNVRSGRKDYKAGQGRINGHGSPLL